MLRILPFVRKFGRDRSGITALEYAILAGLVAAGLAGVFSNSNFFDEMTDRLDDAMNITAKK